MLIVGLLVIGLLITLRLFIDAAQKRGQRRRTSGYAMARKGRAVGLAAETVVSQFGIDLAPT